MAHRAMLSRKPAEYKPLECLWISARRFQTFHHLPGPDMQSDSEDLKRLYWHSRRGMLELDLLLLPFASEALPAMDAEGQARYRRLLAEEDQDLFLWLTRREPAPTHELQEIVERVLAFGAARVAD